MLYSPSENLNLVNQHLRSVLQEGQYATLIYARLNKARKCLTLVNAGHPAAIILRASGKAEIIHQSGDVLGLFESIAMDVEEIQVAQGDRVFLFSDGLIEQDANGPIPRRIGLTNLVNLIDANPAAKIETTILAIQKQLCTDPQNMNDDAVLLGFEIL